MSSSSTPVNASTGNSPTHVAEKTHEHVTNDKPSANNSIDKDLDHTDPNSPYHLFRMISLLLVLLSTYSKVLTISIENVISHSLRPSKLS